MESQNTVYIDGENFFYRVAKILIDHKIIKHKNDIKKFNFNHLLSESIGLKNSKVRYYGTKIKPVKLALRLKKKAGNLLLATEALRIS